MNSSTIPNVDQPVVTFRPFTPAETRLEPTDSCGFFKETAPLSPGFLGSLASTIKHDTPESRLEMSLDFERGKALANALDRLKKVEVTKEQVASELRTQIRTLREQQTLSDQVHAMELEKQRDDYESKLARHLEVSEDLYHQLESAESALAAERQNTAFLTSEIDSLKSNHEQEISKLKGEIQDLKLDIDGLLEEYQASFTEKLTRLQEDSTAQLEAKDEQIHALESEKMQSDAEFAKMDADGKKMRKVLIDLRMESGLEIQRLQDSLAGVRMEVRARTQEIEDLRRSQGRQKTETDLTAKEKNVLEAKISALTTHNNELEEQVARLEKLVFGKGSRRM